MKKHKHSPASSHGHIDKPELTIVGPRPAGQKAEKIPVPQGMEWLLTLAGLNAEWRKKVLADPLGTAEEARIELSSTERVILKSIPKQALTSMVASFMKNSWNSLRGPTMAAGTAAAALLATEFCHAEPGHGVTRGIRPDVPVKPAAGSQIATISWMPSLDAAIASAASNKCAVMVVFPYTTESEEERRSPTDGIRPDTPASRFLVDLCRTNSPAVSTAVKEANLLAVAVVTPAVYLKTVDKFKVAGQTPIVLFLAPDQSVLHKAAPASDAEICEAIKTVPVLLQAWIATQQKPIRPAEPLTKGARPK